MKKFFRKWKIGEISLSALILIVVASISTYYIAMQQVGIVVRLKNISEVSGTTISFRGGMRDDTWISAYDLVEGGNWTYDPQTGIYTSVGDEVLTLRLPVVKQFNIVMNAGPDEGVLEILTENNTYQFDLYQKTEIEYGCALQGLDTFKGQAISIIYSVIVLIAGIFVFAIYNFYNNRIPWSIVEKVYIILLIPAAGLLLYFLSLSSTPRIPEELYFWGWFDGEVYNLIGKSWLHGLIPYKDMFEQKGPGAFFIFMLANYINSHWGVYFLQCICLFISLVFSYKIGKLLSSEGGGIVASLASMVYFVAVIDEGGLLEEFNLPLLMISCYLVLKYAINADKRVRHPWNYAVVYGMTFGVSYDLRITNAISICAFVACITFFLLYKKEFKNLIHNIGGFLIGLATVTLPFVIYFAYHGALYDMLHDSILYALDYAGEAIPHTSEEWKQIIIYLIPVITCLFLSMSKKGVMRYAIIMGAISEIFMMSRSYLYPHYYIVIVIFVPIAIGLFFSDKKTTLTNMNRYTVCYSVICIISILSISGASYQSAIFKYSWITNFIQYKSGIQDSYNIIKQAAMIPEEDRDKVTGYNIKADWYLTTDIYPCYKYYGSNDVLYSTSSMVREESIEYYSTLDAKWIVVQSEIGDEEIKALIEENYQVVSQIDMSDGSGKISLYKRLDLDY